VTSQPSVALCSWLRAGVRDVTGESYSLVRNPSVHAPTCHNTSIVARQRLGKIVTAGKNTRNNRRILGPIVFHTICVLSKETRRLFLPRTSCFSSRRIISGEIVFAEILLLPKFPRFGLVCLSLREYVYFIPSLLVLILCMAFRLSGNQINRVLSSI
jgi:hypothetical protein